MRGWKPQVPGAAACRLVQCLLLTASIVISPQEFSARSRVYKIAAPGKKIRPMDQKIYFFLMLHASLEKGLDSDNKAGKTMHLFYF